METKKWKPEVEDEYYVVCVDWEGVYVHRTQHINTYADLRSIELNNCFKTRTEANKKMKLIKAILKQP